MYIYKQIIFSQQILNYLFICDLPVATEQLLVASCQLLITVMCKAINCRQNNSQVIVGIG